MATIEALNYIESNLRFDADDAQSELLYITSIDPWFGWLFRALEAEKCVLVGDAAAGVMEGRFVDRRERVDVLYLGEKSLDVLKATLNDSKTVFDLLEYGVYEKNQLATTRKQLEYGVCIHTTRVRSQVIQPPASDSLLKDRVEERYVIPDPWFKPAPKFRVIKFDAKRFTGLEEHQVKTLLEFAVVGSYGRASERVSISFADGRCMRVPWGPEENFDFLDSNGQVAKVKQQPPQVLKDLAATLPLQPVCTIQDSWARAAEDDAIEALLECFHLLSTEQILCRGCFASHGDRLDALTRRNRSMQSLLERRNSFEKIGPGSSIPAVPGWYSPRFRSDSDSDSDYDRRLPGDSGPRTPPALLRKYKSPSIELDQKSKVYKFLITAGSYDDEENDTLMVAVESTLSGLLDRMAKTCVFYELSKGSRCMVRVNQWNGKVMLRYGTQLKKFFSTDSRHFSFLMPHCAYPGLDRLMERARESVYRNCYYLYEKLSLSPMRFTDLEFSKSVIKQKFPFSDLSEWVIAGPTARSILDERYGSEEIHLFRGGRRSATAELALLIEKSSKVVVNSKGDILGGTISDYRSDFLHYRFFETFSKEETMMAAINTFNYMKDRVAVDLGSGKYLSARWTISMMHDEGEELAEYVAPRQVLELLPYCNGEEARQAYSRSRDGLTADMDSIYESMKGTVYCAALLKKEDLLECFESMPVSSSDEEF